MQLKCEPDPCRSRLTALANPYDFNRDRRVNAADEAIAGANYTNVFTALKLITAPVLPPVATGSVVSSVPQQSQTHLVTTETPLPLTTTSGNAGLSEPVPTPPPAMADTPATQARRASNCRHSKAAHHQASSKQHTARKAGPPPHSRSQEVPPPLAPPLGSKWSWIPSLAMRGTESEFVRPWQALASRSTLINRCLGRKMASSAPI
jgi:hypothetical protein